MHSRSSHQRCSVKKGVLRNFAKFTGKHLCQSLFLINLQDAPATLLKKRLWRRCFPVHFAKFLWTLFLQNTSCDCFWPFMYVLFWELSLFIKRTVVAFIKRLLIISIINAPLITDRLASFSSSKILIGLFEFNRKLVDIF